MLKVITSFIQEQKVVWFMHNKVGRTNYYLPDKNLLILEWMIGII
jgi:hypothetical protein